MSTLGRYAEAPELDEIRSLARPLTTPADLDPVLEAIGVVYHPERERRGNWVPTVLGRRYDAFLSFDWTDALHPLHWEAPQPHAEKETYPSGR